MEPQVTFGSFRFEPASARLWENDAEIKLTRKAALVLAALLERRGAPVSKQELFANVWRGTVVSDDALVTCIQELRKALRDDDRHYIETRHRLGYLFAAPVADVRAGSTPPPVAETPSDASTIAVLPFADMSAERDQDYLCEGIAEELIDALTHIEGLRVAARTSSFQFRGNHDLREVGRKLGVGTLLEGSVRKAGDRLRITVQLIDVAHRLSQVVGEVRSFGRRRVRRAGRDRRDRRDAAARRRAECARTPRGAAASPPPSRPTNGSCAAGSACTTGATRGSRKPGTSTNAPSRSMPDMRPPGPDSPPCMR